MLPPWRWVGLGVAASAVPGRVRPGRLTAAAATAPIPPASTERRDVVMSDKASFFFMFYSDQWVEAVHAHGRAGQDARRQLFKINDSD
jgi:hypothetical protein